MSASPTLAAIRGAAQALHGIAKHTPLIRSKTFSDLTGCSLHLKLENLQVTGSFKLRGAYTKIHGLTESERACGVVCASAGNHAQGVAFSATAMGVASTVFMPVFAPPPKIQATRAYGATVELVGANYDEAYEAARQHADVHGATFVHAFDDPAVVAGQGTLGLEILDDLPEVEAVLVPIGGGGLIAGIALAIKALRPDVRVIGVQAAGAASMQHSLTEGAITTLPSVQTIADGIAVRRPGAVTFPIVQEHVDEVVTVSDEAAAYALYLLVQRAKLIAEPACVVGLAALLTGVLDLPGQTVAAVLTGGNVDLGLLSQILERGLRQDGLRAGIAVDVPDRPGMLNELVDILSDLRANIQTITHDRETPDIPVGHARVSITFRTLGHQQIAAVAEALRARGLTFTVLT